jgi:hypothetical protein
MEKASGIPRRAEEACREPGAASVTAVDVHGNEKSHDVFEKR